MIELHSLARRFFDKVILERPGLVIICLLAVVSFLGYKAKDFKLDASAETLVLQSDKDLRYSRLINSRYGIQDYLLMTYAPKDDLFSDKVLANLTRLRDELKQLERVSSVVSILDVPLLESPPVPLKKLASNIRNLESPKVDKKLARIEFSKSPLYQNLLVSPDLKTTALQIKFPIDKTYQDLLARRNHFREKQAANALSAAEAAEFKKVSAQFQKHRDKMKKTRHQDIAQIRAIMDNYRQDAELFLGGISMIADDLITFIKNDLKTFGLGVLFFLVVTLSVIFRKMRWIFLPMLCCGFSAMSMMGLLGLFGWEVTVISSNFISLQLIITMAITIHLIVRYRELHFNNPETEHRKLILDAVCLMLKPCLYAGLTTVAGFGSLLLCDILPVITFGWMMSAGITVSLAVTFLLFPAMLMLMRKGTPQARRNSHFSLTSFLARFTQAHGVMILAIGCITLIVSAIGISKLEVENSFIDYFKHTTEIYQGMKVIDQNLGGTTPLDVIVELDKPETLPQKVAPETDTQNDDEFEEFAEFDEAEDDEKYWFTSDKMAQVKKIHDYLDSLPETGKVLSLETIIKIAEKLNNGKPLDNFALALLYSKIPDKSKSMVLKPYVSVEHNEVRFSIRVRDSEKSLKRDTLLKKIQHDLISKLGLKKEHTHLTGMLVLYNNMLQSLFSSQILTLGVVILALMSMFLILFRSLKIALIAIFPNLLSIGAVLGVMGWLIIPLDMMTITFSAISVGIAVDDTIHYIHRFKHEFRVDRNYINTVYSGHGTIGHAMYYTSVTIIIGFSILVLSNFIPSIYFGLLTGLAMLIALIAALTLLPQLLVIFKPFGPEVGGNQQSS
ncbi:MAG: RND family transporter [Desulfobacterales bacterium]|nr:MAG: RND family transporter [Desulfobacterales bacterium]